MSNMKIWNDAAREAAARRAMVQTNHERSQAIPGNIHDEEAFAENARDVRQRRIMEQMHTLQASGVLSQHDMRKQLETCGFPSPPKVPTEVPLSQTDASAIVTGTGEQRPVAGYPFKDEIVVSLSHFNQIVAQLSGLKYENVKLTQKVNDLTSALSTARDAASDLARDKGHLERRIGELVVEAEHYKARMKR